MLTKEDLSAIRELIQFENAKLKEEILIEVRKEIRKELRKESLRLERRFNKKIDTEVEYFETRFFHTRSDSTA